MRPSSGSWSILKSPVCSTEPGGGADGDRERVGNRMVDGEELAVERAEAGPALLDDLEHLGLHPVLGELRAQQRQGEAAADHQQIGTLAQQERHRADVVLVGVGEHDGLDVAEPISDGAEVRQDQIDARLVGLREEHPAIDDQQSPGVLENGHIATDLAEAAERDDAQALLRQRPGGAEIGMRVAHARQLQPGRRAVGPQRRRSRSGVASTSGSRTGPAGRPSRPSAALVMITPWVRKKPV